jgi:antitoxin component of MazEF toxin-antitoxin module
MGKHKPYRVERRVYEQGGCLTIALPPIWARAMELGRGKKVECLFDAEYGGALVVRPIEASPEMEAAR